MARVSNSRELKHRRYLEMFSLLIILLFQISADALFQIFKFQSLKEEYDR